MAAPADDFSALMAAAAPPMFIVTTAAGGERAGCLVGFAAQASIDPPRMVVMLSDKNRTAEVAARATHLALHFPSAANLALARLFGEETGDEVDKFAGCRWQPGPGGVPLLEGTCGWAVLRVVERTAAGDHIVHLAEVEEARREAGGPPLTLHDVSGLEPGHQA